MCTDVKYVPPVSVIKLFIIPPAPSVFIKLTFVVPVGTSNV